ncbi:MAG: peptidylprolyl isomerase [Lachnospiraceae bacterium]|nr:peptidylprolyl isomerase [Lachnospiraceae bacterium]
MKKRVLTGFGKKGLALMLAGILGGALLTGCGSQTGTTSDKGQAENQSTGSTTLTGGTQSAGQIAADNQENEQAEELLSGKHHVEITIKDMGVIYVELDADAAPITVTNFVKLAEEGFYDGLTFHRIIAGFMIQGGDPEGTGMGGSDNPITGEFASNGIENPLSHTRGAISMARSSRPNSASSQFFIVHEDSTFLDGEYAAFGYVTEGMDIVDTICETTTGQDGNGIVPEENRPVIESIKVVD